MTLIIDLSKTSPEDAMDQLMKHTFAVNPSAKRIAEIEQAQMLDGMGFPETAKVIMPDAEIAPGPSYTPKSDI